MPTDGPGAGDMSDQDARAKAKFEPPPWEQEAFEALAAKRAEEQAARDAFRDTAAEDSDRPQDPWEEVPAPRPAEDRAEVQAGADGDGSPAIADRAAADRAAESLLLRLQQEERTPDRASKWVGWIASAVTFVLGAAMLVAGLAAVRTGGAKPVTIIGSGILSVFGLCFIGMAMWVWISTNRSRGRG
jgi:hypothetical protein